MIKQYFLDYRAHGLGRRSSTWRPATVELRAARRRGLDASRCVDTGDESMTGAPREARRAATSATPTSSSCTYGDGLADVDVAALVAFHRSHGKLATVTGVHPPSRFGELVRRRHRGARASPRSPADDGLDQRRLLRLRRARARPALARPRAASSSASRWRGWPRDGELRVYRARRLLAVRRHGARRRAAARPVGRAASAPWRVWDDRRAHGAAIARPSRRDRRRSTRPRERPPARRARDARAPPRARGGRWPRAPATSAARCRSSTS